MHLGQKPIVLVDFLSLSNGIVGQFKNEFIFGGRHQHIHEYFKSLLIKFTKIGCRLVFFSDYNIQADKKDEWLSRRNSEFYRCTQVYDWIMNDPSPDEMKNIPYELALKSTNYEMEIFAKCFGEMHYTVKRECDLEIVHFAKQHNAMAIISCDTDFLIFNGSWRLWSSDDIKLDSGKLTTLEYKKNALKKLCSQQKLPLLATLVGNDFTKVFARKLNLFHCSLGEKDDKVKNVARFIRPFKCVKLSDNQIRKIFGNASDRGRMLIEKSLDFYKMKDSLTTIDDPIAEHLFGSPSYPAYITIMGPIHGINMNYYDMRGCAEGTSLPLLLIDWLKRKIGLLRKQNNDETFTFTLLTKKSLDERFMEYDETPIYPERMHRIERWN